MVGTRTQTYIAIPQPNPLSLYTKLEGPSIAKLYCNFPQYGLLMIFDFQRALRFSWSWLLVYM